MKCPTLCELPQPPEGRTGWPWTEESPQMPDSHPWPRITVITPSYNQGQFIEETIRSILLQGYPNLEYIIIDGGSSDDSLNIIRKYEGWLSYWVSEPDSGQANAINKGLARATGSIIQWINSDDLLQPAGLAEVGQIASSLPGHLIAGGCEQFADGKSPLKVFNRNLSAAQLVAFWGNSYDYQQPSFFVPGSAVAEVGLLDESLHYCFDLDWTIRLLDTFPVFYTKTILTRFRLHPDSKTCAHWPKLSAERGVVSQRYWDKFDGRRLKLEYQAYRRRELWYSTLGYVLGLNITRIQKLNLLFQSIHHSPWRFLRRETWGAMRRIIFSR
jgi:glycosyltransferase involved in cell wall biosynthesis